MARVKIIDPATVTDPISLDLFAWVAEAEGEVPNHFLVEMNFPEYFNAKLGATRVLWQAGELTMEEVQHVGVVVSKANNCEYCTAAFCTILNYALDKEQDYVTQLLEQGVEVIDDHRLRTLLEFCLKANADPQAVTDEEVEGLRSLGLTDKGIVQLVHLVSDFASYNRLNQVLKTDYDYRDLWRKVGFDWQQREGEAVGDNARGLPAKPQS
jgi:uncharacterized peroxidase-related enzyme